MQLAASCKYRTFRAQARRWQDFAASKFPSPSDDAGEGDRAMWKNFPVNSLILVNKKRNFRPVYSQPSVLPHNASACAGKRMRTEHSGRRAPVRSRNGSAAG
jgi:hypothetical protein